MEIYTRTLQGGCVDVDVEHNGTKINIGLLDSKERIELATHLSGVVSDLLNGVEVRAKS